MTAADRILWCQACKRATDDPAHVFACQRECRADFALTPEQRLREISRLWYVATSQGRPFLANTDDVPAMRALLEGFDHPDEVPDD